jgi:hypothetical protein
MRLGQSCWPERRWRQTAADHAKLPGRMALWYAPGLSSSSPIPILLLRPQLALQLHALLPVDRHQQLEFIHSFTSVCTVLACFFHQLQQSSSVLSIIANRSAPATESDKPCMMTPDCNMHAGKRLTAYYWWRKSINGSELALHCVNTGVEYQQETKHVSNQNSQEKLNLVMHTGRPSHACMHMCTCENPTASHWRIK